MELTEEQAVRIGLAFRNCAKGEDFDVAVETLKTQYMQMITSSDYSDLPRREQAFQQLRALEELITTINTFIAIAEAGVTDPEFDAINIFE